ncbi:MAG: BBP7 family outer membrane beta-barrel protein [Gemmataceae bacterium]
MRCHIVYILLATSLSPILVFGQEPTVTESIPVTEPIPGLGLPVFVQPGEDLPPPLPGEPEQPEELPAPTPAPVPSFGPMDTFQELPPFEEMPQPEPEPGDGIVFPPSLFWVRASYLHFALRDDIIPILVTVGSTDDPVPGAIGQTGTSLAFLDRIDDDARDGVRIVAGLARESEGLLSLEADFLYLTEQTARFVPITTDNQVIARPFLDPVTGAESAFIVSSPNNVAGEISATASSELWGFELNARRYYQYGPTTYVHLVGGLRYLRLVDELRISELSQNISILPLPTNRADVIARFDDFLTDNDFIGAQIGVGLDYAFRRMWIQLYGKFALGVTQQSLTIAGGTQASNIGGTTFNPVEVGFLAQSTNIGQRSRGEFSFVPEVGFTIGYQLTSHLKLSAGYTAIFWNSVARPGQQVDRMVNTSQAATLGTAGALQGPAFPKATFREADFWTRGAHFSLELRY